MTKITTVGLAACFALSLCRATAQNPGALQQMDAVQQRERLSRTAKSFENEVPAPELYRGETNDIGPQSILQFKPRKTYIEAIADAQYFFTDNMFLNEHDKVHADVLVSTAQIALAPTAYDLGGGQFAPRVGYKHQWYDYGLISDKQVTVADFNTLTAHDVALNAFDFNAQTIFTDAHWMRDNWIFMAGFEFTRLLDTGHYDQFYREYVPRWGAQRNFVLNESSVLSLGYEGDYRFADTDLPPFPLSSDFNSRTDHSLVVSFSQNVCSRALVQPYYRFKYTHYTEGEIRDDYLNSFGLALYCAITPQITLRGFVGYDILETNSELVPDYKRLDAGGGINLTFRF